MPDQVIMEDDHNFEKLFYISRVQLLKLSVSVRYLVHDQLLNLRYRDPYLPQTAAAADNPQESSIRMYGTVVAPQDCSPESGLLKPHTERTIQIRCYKIRSTLIMLFLNPRT